ncbi:MAG: monovalent cation/H+ antiporter complex subunit F [Acidilobaceae archaeon]
MGVAILVYLLSALLHSYRALRGPSLPDRVLAVDCISYAFIALLVSLSVMYRYWFFLHIAFLVAVFVFVLDAAVARYLEERGG